MPLHPSARFFLDRYNLTERHLEQFLAAALEGGGEYADLYFEYQASTSIGLDESLIKSDTEGASVGCGVRVINGERTGYAYTDDLTPERIRHAAKLAACISQGPAQS